MNVILGIDTGGTFTDGVLIDYNTKKIIRGVKALTTQDDLAVGIDECIRKLNIRSDEYVCLVGVSTTLATNAIVEDQGAKAGLITINEPFDRDYPVEIKTDIKGTVDIMGRERSLLDADYARQALQAMKGKIETLAISGQSSVKNPLYELEIKHLAKDILGLPTVCGHEMTSALGFYERTVTTVLNAKLIPIIADFFKDIKSVLIEHGIDAPVMGIKGDGHSIAGAYMQEYPVESVLSGPAASLIGGQFLAGLDNMLVIDMGGTTTDIVNVADGEAVLEDDGMNIGGWKTKVRSVRVHTYGLGGDSQLVIDSDHNLSFGPRKVIPLCLAANRWPYLVDELKNYRLPDNYYIIKHHDVEAIRLFKDKNINNYDLSERDRSVLEQIRNGAHTLSFIAEQLNTDIDSLGIEKLQKLELIQLISLTPTDIVHALGEYTEFNTSASELGFDILAKRLNTSKDSLIKKAEDIFVDQICHAIIHTLCVLERNGNEKTLSTEHYFIGKMLDNKEGLYSLIISLNMPIVGVGAPAGAWLRRAAERLQTDFILPDYSHIANAVGAAVSDVRENLTAIIQPDPLAAKLTAFLPDERRLYDSLDEARAETIKHLRIKADELAKKLCIEQYSVEIQDEDQFIENAVNGTNTFIKSIIKAELRGDML